MSSGLPPQTTVTIEGLMRWAGILGIIGGVALAAAYLTHPVPCGICPVWMAALSYEHSGKRRVAADYCWHHCVWHGS